MTSILTLLALTLPAQTKDAVFDRDAIARPALNARVVKQTEKDGIVTEEVRFHSETDGGKDVDLFAFFSYPKGAKGLPAFIWNQGGLAQASTYWTEFGAKRGYAALCIDFPIPGYRSTGGYPINSNLELGDDPKQAPIYHGAVALLRAMSFLESRKEVDAKRIGMAGSSWGGFYTTLQTGLDPRIKVGSSMFGCGALAMGNLWWDGQGPNPKRDDAFRRRWDTSLDPAHRLGKTPMALFTGTNDQFYWLPSVVESYRRCSGPRHLALLPNWNHALTPELDEQVFYWLDVHLKGAEPFVAVEPLTIAGRKATWTFAGRTPVKSAELSVSFRVAGSWVGRNWLTIPARIDGTRCEADIPSAQLPAQIFGTVIDERGFRSSTLLTVVNGDTGPMVPAYDGCAEWGGFEEKHWRYLTLHGLAKPKKDDAGHAILAAGATTLGPVLFTQGVPHEVVVRLQSDTPVSIQVGLSGSFDGKAEKQQQDVEVKTTTSEVRLAFTPPEAKSGRMNVTFQVPAKAKVRLERVQCLPK